MNTVEKAAKKNRKSNVSIQPNKGEEMKDKTEIQLIEAERWQNELIDALENTRPAYVFRVAEELSRLFPDVEEYDPYAGSGLPDFIVCNQKPSDAELRAELKELAADLEEAEEKEKEKADK